MVLANISAFVLFDNCSRNEHLLPGLMCNMRFRTIVEKCCLPTSTSAGYYCERHPFGFYFVVVVAFVWFPNCERSKLFIFLGSWKFVTTCTGTQVK